MDDVPTLLAASYACGGHTDTLGRWLLTGTAELDTPAALAQANISKTVHERFQRADRAQLCRQWDALAKRGWQLVPITDQQRYPALLRQIEDPPGILYVRGRHALLQAPQIAVVGARGASAEGRGNAEHFSRALSQAGFCITSGLALGIDASAHRAALPNTLAVLGHGPDRIYPARHQTLAENIATQGLLVTEYPPGLPPRREHFPARNRIISGLSLAVLVIEAAAASGSLITARLAATQGRDVFAVPGSIHNPLSRGCHQLLRDGALWLESIDDLRSHFNVLTETACGAEDHEASPLLKEFVGGVNSIDALAARTGLDWQHLTRTLLELELGGQIERVSGGYMRRR